MPSSRKFSLRRPITLLLMLALMVGLVSPFVGNEVAEAPAAGLPSRGATDRTAPPLRDKSRVAVEGWVKDSQGRPVPGATVSLESRQAISDGAGYFSFRADGLSRLARAANADFSYVQVSVTAQGYADWTILQARYFPRDTLRLYPHLNPAGAPPSRFIAAMAPVVNSSSPAVRASLASALPEQHTAGFDLFAKGLASSDLSPLSAAPAVPAQIRVYRTGTGEVEIVPFKEYVKHVLPNEWISSWAQASLRAGAMAVKEYAWFWIARGGKQTALGADVKDNTDDQVYDPNVSYASTDTAVDATWQYSMTRNGALFQASYCAGSYQEDPSADCPWDNVFMTQWGSKYYADQGRSWSWILRFYYSNVVISPTPPGGDGGPPPSRAQPTSQPVVPTSYSVGQGAVQPLVFQEAYERNGGARLLGNPTGPVRWWLPYVSENNVLAQPYAGSGGRGASWLVFDTLKSNISGINQAYLLSGDIAAAYGSNTPPGPEWVGAPTSDPYVALTNAGGLASQGFTKGTLAFDGHNVQFTPWPAQFSGWEADYYVGRPLPSIQTGPTLSLPGQPANVLDVPTPNMDWPSDAAVPKGLGLGTGAWSAQFSRSVQVDPGSYDFVITADSGVRLWIDGLLAINAWDSSGPHRETYNADLDASPHEIRVQYFSPGGVASLDYSLTERGKGQPLAPQDPEGPQGASGQASLRVQVAWLGRAPAPNDGWIQPLTLSLSVPGNPVPIGSYAANTDRNGVAIYDGLPTGTYDVHVKGAHSLQTARAGIVLNPNRTADVDMKAQVDGDLDGDNCVTIDDFAAVQAMVGTDKNTPGFNSAADLNGDGQVTVADVSLLRSGFDRCGDISADTDLTALSSAGAPSLSEALAPWLSASALQHNLSLGLMASRSSVKAGATVQVAVIANTGSQPIDGSSFLLRYDPSSLVPVDASGNDTTLSEPGVSLPAVLTNWIDPKGGAIGYAAGMLQGDAPSGEVVLTTLTFRAVKSGATSLYFAPVPSSLMQLTNGGVNLLSNATPLTLPVAP